MYQFPGFTKEDFKVFLIPEFHERMSRLRTQIRPKLAMLGEDLAPQLATLTGHPMFPHTASHARRRVNPPDDTWVAFSRSERGYKRYAHFEVGVALDYVFIRFVIKPEGEEDKRVLIRYLEENGPVALALSDPRPLYWYRDDHGKDPLPLARIGSDEWPEIIRHAQVKSHGFTVGVVIPSDDPVVRSAELIGQAYNTVAHLVPLYRSSLSVTQPQS